MFAVGQSMMAYLSSDDAGITWRSAQTQVPLHDVKDGFFFWGGGGGGRRPTLCHGHDADHDGVFNV